MDEAERCDELVYIAYGHVLARGNEKEVLAQAGVQNGNLEDAFIALIGRAKDNFADARDAA
jgi:ABC-2 type transport system ATP-binding protein